MEHTQSHVNLAQTNLGLRFPNLNIDMTPAFQTGYGPKEGKITMSTFVQSGDKSRLVFATIFLNYNAYENPFIVIEK